MADELRCHLGGTDGGGDTASNYPNTTTQSSTKAKKRDSMASLHSLDLGPPNDFEFSDSDDSDSGEPTSNHNSERSFGVTTKITDGELWNSAQHYQQGQKVVDDISFAPVDNVLRYHDDEDNGASKFCSIWHMIPNFGEMKRKRRNMMCLASIAVVCIFSFLVVGNNGNDDEGGGERSSSFESLMEKKSGEVQNKEDMKNFPPPAQNNVVLDEQDFQGPTPNFVAEAPGMDEIEDYDDEEENAVIVEPVRPCILNGDFNSNPPTSNWYAVHADLLPIPQGGINAQDGGNAMAIINRSNQQWGGIWQNIPSTCLTENEWYEVRAYYHLVVSSDNTNEEYTCDPAIFWNNNVQSCPAISIRVDKELSEIGWSVGPHHSSINGKWHEMYGAFQANSDMIHNHVSIFIAGAPIGADIILDGITLRQANQDTVGVIPDGCSSSLIKNGNAETGDFRYWFIRGEGGDTSGAIQMSLGYENVGFAFKHVGYRGNRWRGLLQKLDKHCLTVGSKWKITAVFKYFQEDQGTGEDVPMECVKNDPFDVYSCPVFQVDFFTPGTKDLVSTGPMVNGDADEFRLGGWNRLEHTLEIVEDMAYHSDAWIYINSVEEGYNYEIDEIEMVPL